MGWSNGGADRTRLQAAIPRILMGSPPKTVSAILGLNEGDRLSTKAAFSEAATQRVEDD